MAGYNPLLAQTPGANGNNPMAVDNGGQPIPASPKWVNFLMNSGNALMNAVTAPSNALMGKYDQIVVGPDGRVLSMFDPRMVDDAATLSGLVTTGGAAMPKLPNTLGIFGGKMAQTADHAALAKAEQMAAAGAHRDDIWNATGWFKGVDDQWRFEIPDNKAYYDAESLAELKQVAKDEGRAFNQKTDTMPLGGVIGHNALYAAYPDMGDIPVHFLDRPTMGRASAAYTPRLDRLSLAADNTADDMLTFGLHEKQHAVQNREGFARGGSPDDPEIVQMASAVKEKKIAEANAGINDLMQSRPDLASVYRARNRAMIAKDWESVSKAEDMLLADPAGKQMLDLDWERNVIASEPAPDPLDIYRSLSGEVEARNVQSRMNMTPEERRAKAPWLTQDVPDDQQIVRAKNGLINQLMTEAQPSKIHTLHGWTGS